MLLCLVMLITSTVNTTYGFIVTATDPLVNTFVPEEHQLSGLTIHKTVEHPYGSDYKIPDNIVFEFMVELGDYYANAKLTTSAGEITADETGTLYVTVKPGVAFTVEGLKEGTVARVTELPTALSGFALEGEETREVTIGADGSVTVEFVNVYTPESVKPDNVSVLGTKILEGRSWQAGDSFTFLLEQKQGEEWSSLGQKTVTFEATNPNFNRFDFTDVMQDLTFDAPGTYDFRMSEVTGELEHVDYDQTVNHFSIHVTDVDMDGKLEINTVTGTENAAVSLSDGHYTVSVTFNNTYEPPVLPDPDNLRITVDVDKKVKNTGDVSHGLKGFEFVLENTATGEKLAAISDGDGNATFQLTFTKADINKTYTYKLYETDQEQEGMTYDPDVHTLTVSITLSQDNKLVATLTKDGQSVESLSAVFENTYHKEQSVAPPTGDSSNLTFWFVMMLVSVTMLVALLVFDRKRKPKV